MPATEVEVLVDGLDHPEEVAWDPATALRGTPLHHPERWAVDA